MSTDPSVPVMMAGIPQTNRSLFRAVRFNCGDPVAFIMHGDGSSDLILRDIEVERARQQSPATRVVAPDHFAPSGGLSGDRETATAQAAAECIARTGATQVIADRTLPLLFASLLSERDIEVQCDRELGVTDRRRKNADELDALRAAQELTEGAIAMACTLIARAKADHDGVLMHDGNPLTAERVRSAIDVWLLEHEAEPTPSIVAPGVIGADCHELGYGMIRTGEPVIIDIFPRDRGTLYNGDCTRTVVHGTPSGTVARMHAAVVEAKAAAIAAVRPGATGEDVHRATLGVLTAYGFESGLPKEGDPETRIAITHGTGHGVGLDVHEPPLLDIGGPELIVGDVLTVEPGLYGPSVGGLRIEDMVAVTDDGCENFNTLPVGLDWSEV